MGLLWGSVKWWVGAKTIIYWSLSSYLLLLFLSPISLCRGKVFCPFVLRYLYWFLFWVRLFFQWLCLDWMKSWLNIGRRFVSVGVFLNSDKPLQGKFVCSCYVGFILFRYNLLLSLSLQFLLLIMPNSVEFWGASFQSLRKMIFFFWV